MKQKIILSLMTLILFITPVHAEDIIRYTTDYSLPAQDASFAPTNEDIQEWYNVDLPRDDNGELQYTIEFDTTQVKFDTPGDYQISMIFYKTVDHKFQKVFNLKITEPVIPEKEPLIGKIELDYLKQVGLTVLLGVAVYVVLSVLINISAKTRKYVILYNNKIYKTVRSKKILDYKQIIRKLKIKEAATCIIMHREDVPKYIEEMTKKIKKYDYVVEVKN